MGQRLESVMRQTNGDKHDSHGFICRGVFLRIGCIEMIILILNMVLARYLHVTQNMVSEPFYVQNISGMVLTCGSVCMGSSYRCIVACAHLGNGRGRTTTTTSGPVRYQTVLHSCGTSPVGEVRVTTYL